MNHQSRASSVEQTPSLVRVASDELLVLGARLHDDVALGVLYDRYGAEAYAVALETLRERDAAEAAMQDAFLRIWRGVEIYDASLGSTRDWLIGIARGRALTALARLEPFGGVPDQVASLEDAGLLASVEPASGARDRLLARARAEGGGARSAEAPTVVIPAAELGPEPELPPDGAPTAEAEAASDAASAKHVEPEPEVELASEAPTLTGLPILEPPTLNGEHVVDAEAVMQEVELPAGDIVDTEGVRHEVTPASGDAGDTEGVAQEVAAVPAKDVAAEDDDGPEPHGRKPSELGPSEALAAALAQIPPRRPQQESVADEAPRKRRIKLASISWGAALLFVVASGLSVAAWSATGPHLSLDLNVLSRLPGGRIVVLRGAGTPPAIVRLHSVDSGRRAELAAESLPTLPSGRVYQVWLIEPGQAARSGGAFFVNRRGDAVVPVSLGGPVERFQAIAITQEPAPGTSAPTGSRILEGTP